MTFSVIGEGDPFLLVELTKGEEVYAQADAMITMSATLSLSTGMQGGLLQSLGRKAFGGEGLFNQKLVAEAGNGVALLAPASPGAIEVISLPAEGISMNDGAFLAASAGVSLGLKAQGLIKGFLGQTGGLVTMAARGAGDIVVSGFGNLQRLEVDEAGLIVDTGHVVCWSNGLDYSVGVRTNKRQGLVKSLVTAATSGEGLVTTFTGRGTVWVCSRNYDLFAKSILSLLPSTKGAGG